MIDLLQEFDFAIDAALQRHVARTRKTGPSDWNFTLPSAVDLRVAARRCDDWLTLRAENDGLSPGEGAWVDLGLRGLQLNSALAGGVKFAMENRPRRLVLCTEMPLHDALDVQARLGEAFEGFRQAAVRFPSPVTASSVEVNTAAPCTSATEDLRGWQELCREPPWYGVERGDGTTVVQLDVSDLGFQAVLQQTAGGRPRLRVDLGRVSESWVARYANTVLLLEACRAVRMARAIAEQSEGEDRAAWEVVLADAPNPIGLNHALHSLSVACRLTARELRSVENEPIAGTYLKIRGWPPL